MNSRSQNRRGTASCPVQPQYAPRTTHYVSSLKLCKRDNAKAEESCKKLVSIPIAMCFDTNDKTRLEVTFSRGSSLNLAFNSIPNPKELVRPGAKLSLNHQHAGPAYQGRSVHRCVSLTARRVWVALRTSGEIVR